MIYWVFTFIAIIGLSEGLSSTVSNGMSHFEPQIALLCENNPGIGSVVNYHPQYMNENGKWETDLSTDLSKLTGDSCQVDKLDLLYYCKRLYPKRDITNIVESSHYLKVSSWCKFSDPSKCKTTRWVKPYRCLEGAFQSDALLVPENCLFDHIHNQSRCWTFNKWNLTALTACNDRNLQLRSFAMLLPCGISLFSGVEFVCCPKNRATFKDNLKIDSPVSAQNLGLTDDDDDDDDSDDEAVKNDNDDYDENLDENDDDEIQNGDETDDFDLSTSTQSSVTAEATKPTTSPLPIDISTANVNFDISQKKMATPDPYFTHFDPRNEHQSYKEAQERLEEAHREKVTRVMKDWSDLEERYQDMRASDPRGAEEFKQRMTSRFQATVQALEEEGDAEKHQLAAMHQQRVLAHINQRKREAMACYTQALSDQPTNVHRVQKCLQKLLRALHKDRAHAIAHYRHLLAGGGLDAAAREQPRTLERLSDIDRTVNQSLQMLKRYPDLSQKIGQLMDDYVQALRSKDETPGSLLAMTTEAEAAILDKYRADVTARRAERERLRQQERQRKIQRKKEKQTLAPLTASNEKTNDDDFDLDNSENDYPIDTNQNMETSTKNPTSEKNIVSTTMDISTVPTVAPPSHATVDDLAVQQAVETVAAAIHHEEIIRVAHSMSHEMSHGEPTYSVRREVYNRHTSSNSGRSVYFTLAFAGMALMAATIVGMAVIKRRNSRSPHNQGFVQVDQLVTPEERHVQNMQINGYENPTYKYFEAKE